MNTDLLTQLFFQMLRIRMVEEKIAESYPNQEMRCPVHLCIGQEAVAVGVCACLTDDDYVMSNHRSHGHYLAKGGCLRSMMAEIHGRVTGCSLGKGGSMHLADASVGFLGATPIVASSMPIALGAAFGSLMQNEKRVSIAFFGDGATEEGVFHECLNIAALKHLPIIFICENNLYSVYSPLSVRQPDGREIFSIAKGHNIESHQGNGNDVMEVYERAEKAVKKARGGRGPTFIEFKTYRFREHCGPHFDNELGYRTEEEFHEWEKMCPVTSLKTRLLRDEILSNRDIHKMEKNIQNEIESSLLFAMNSPFPETDSLIQHIYA